jgi:hypothetical protein
MVDLSRIRGDRNWIPISVSIGLLALLVGVAVGQDDLSADAEGRGTSRARPDMPTVEEAERITRARVVVDYPRVVPIIQYGFAAAPSDEMVASFNGVLEAVGLDATESFTGKFQHVDYALRVDINYRWRVAAECVMGWNKGDAVEDFRRYGVMVTRALTPEDFHKGCLSGGAGICLSQIVYQRDYKQRIPGTSSYLSKIRWQSDWRAVLPVQLMLEVPNLRYSRAGLAHGCLPARPYRFGHANQGPARQVAHGTGNARMDVVPRSGRGFLRPDLDTRVVGAAEPEGSEDS